MANDLNKDELAGIERLRAAHRDLKAEIGKVIVGQEEVVDQLRARIAAVANLR